jgi:hypothetical protein
MEAIAGPFNAAICRQFVDISTKFLDARRHYTYQLKLVRMKGTPVGTVAESAPFTWEDPRDVVAEFVTGEHNFKFRYVSGVPILVFNRRHASSDMYCTNCWNPVLKKIQHSNCTQCYGTGVARGYYDPVYTWADLSPESSSSQIVEWGEKQPSQLDVLFTDYPNVREKDLIVEMVSNKHWVVVNTMSAERRRATMMQMLRLDLVNPSDVEYKVHIPEELKARASRELAELRGNKYTL